MNEYEIVQHRQMEGISLFLDTVDYRTPHVHPEWELLWILDAPLAVTCAQQSFTVPPGQLILFHPNEPHEFHRAQKSCTFLCMQVSPKILPGTGQLAVDGRHPEKYLSAGEIRALKTAFFQMAEAYLLRESHFELFCLGRCSLMMHTLLTRLPSRILSAEESASIDRRNARLKRLFRFVDENYMHKIRLTDFAAQEGCSVSYLSHFIKDTMHQTFQDYVNSVRFNCACKLIAGGGMRMLDVCMESGFSDYRYFSQAFHRQFGMTPEEYSRQAAQLQPRQEAIRRSLHSVERFYSREESLALLRAYTK